MPSHLLLQLLLFLARSCLQPVPLITLRLVLLSSFLFGC
jgi:hypothetical protein